MRFDADKARVYRDLLRLIGGGFLLKTRKEALALCAFGFTGIVLLVLCIGQIVNPPRGEAFQFETVQTSTPASTSTPAPTPAPTPTPTPKPTQTPKQKPRSIESKLTDDLMKVVEEEAEEHGLDALLILAVIEIESGYNPAAISQDYKDIGLMQIRTIHEEALIADGLNIHNPSDNIRAGAQILSASIAGRSLSDGLMAYNAGNAGARRLWNKGVHSTQYSRKVIKIYQRLKEEK